MLSIEKCESYFLSKNLDRKRVEQIRDYLYAIGREIIKTEIKNYEKQITKSTRNET
jgi:hypothetical protein